MGTRRDDISSEQRMQIAIDVLNPNRKRGRMAELTRTYAISWQTIYKIADEDEQVLLTDLGPEAHGAQ